MAGIIILAAGNSQRLGSPKQLLLYNGKSLLQHSIDTAIASHCKPVIVVLGANETKILSEINTRDIEIIQNKYWEEGMASSIRCGITHLQKDPNITSAILMLCDQPLVTASLLMELVKRKEETKKHIITCFYNEAFGPPALFDKSLFAELLALEGHEGAKKLLIKNPDLVDSIPFAKGEIDIDTMMDYENLLKKY